MIGLSRKVHNELPLHVSLQVRLVLVLRNGISFGRCLLWGAIGIYIYPNLVFRIQYLHGTTIHGNYRGRVVSKDLDNNNDITQCQHGVECGFENLFTSSNIV